MTRPVDLLRQGRKEELWQMCCGFLGLSLEQFMAIQKRLLLEQIELLKSCELGRRVMHSAMPETVEEFREQVPLTTYADYLPELVEKREDVLPARPAMWVHTLGRAGEYTIKSVPLTERFLQEFERIAGGVGLLASCNSQGDFLVKEHLKSLSPIGSRYYGSGVVGYMVQRALGCDLLPSSRDEGVFQEKMRAGFGEALCRGLDAVGGLTSALVYAGEAFTQGAINVGSYFLLTHPKASIRLMKGFIKSKLAHRPMLPKDLWSIKVALGGGTDSAIFWKRVEELWGKRPLELYAGTDGGIYATQTWDYEGMTFIPNLNFFEFIPEREWFKWQLNHSYQPKTILLDEVNAGENYEIVITNLHGGILTRYRIGDIIKITSFRNERLGIDIPQVMFQGRADDLVDIFGFGRLTEKVIREAIENTEIPCADWIAHKEIVDGKAVLHIYVEPKDNFMASEQSLTAAIHHQLNELNKRYRYNIYAIYGDVGSVLNLNPVEVTLLPRGAFCNYVAQKEVAGIGPIEPQHINPSKEIPFFLGTSKVVAEAALVTEEERVVV